MDRRSDLQTVLLIVAVFLAAFAVPLIDLLMRSNARFLLMALAVALALLALYLLIRERQTAR